MAILRNRIAELRDGNQRDFAAQVGIRIEKLSSLERGVQIPDKDEAIRIAQELREPDETIEEALERVFYQKVDYDFLFRNKIAEARTSQKIEPEKKTRKKFACTLEVSINHLIDLEHGIKQPTKEEKDKILKLVGKSYEEVFMPYKRQREAIEVKGFLIDLSNIGAACKLEDSIPLIGNLKLDLGVLETNDADNPDVKILISNARVSRAWPTNSASEPFGYGLVFQINSDAQKNIINNLPIKHTMFPQDKRRQSDRKLTENWCISVNSESIENPM